MSLNRYSFPEEKLICHLMKKLPSSEFKIFISSAQDQDISVNLFFEAYSKLIEKVVNFIDENTKEKLSLSGIGFVAFAIHNSLVKVRIKQGCYYVVPEAAILFLQNIFVYLINSGLDIEKNLTLVKNFFSSKYGHVHLGIMNVILASVLFEKAHFFSQHIFDSLAQLTISDTYKINEVLEQLNNHGLTKKIPLFLERVLYTPNIAKSLWEVNHRLIVNHSMLNEVNYEKAMVLSNFPKEFYQFCLGFDAQIKIFHDQMFCDEEEDEFDFFKTQNKRIERNKAVYQEILDRAFVRVCATISPLKVMMREAKEVPVLDKAVIPSSFYKKGSVGLIFTAANTSSTVEAAEGEFEQRTGLASMGF